MRTFREWAEQYEDWTPEAGPVTEAPRPDPREVALRAPAYGADHPVPTIAPLDSGGIQVASNRSGITLYATSHAAGSVPPGGGRTVNTIWQCWFSFGVAESGAVEASNTQVDFRVGDDFSTYTTIATGKTTSNPAAGETVYVSVSSGGEKIYRPTPKQTLFVYVTKNGAASVDFDNESFTFGFDLLQERMA